MEYVEAWNTSSLVNFSWSYACMPNGTGLTCARAGLTFSWHQNSLCHLTRVTLDHCSSFLLVIPDSLCITCILLSSYLRVLTGFLLPNVVLIVPLSFSSAVCAFSSTKVFTRIFQPIGAHCTSTSFIFTVVWPLFGLLVDRKESWCLSLHFSTSGKQTRIQHD